MRAWEGLDTQGPVPTTGPCRADNRAYFTPNFVVSTFAYTSL